MSSKKFVISLIVTAFVVTNCLGVLGSQLKKESNNIFETTDFETKYIELEISFSKPEVSPHFNYYVVRVNETNHNRIVVLDRDPGKPVLPVNLSVFNLEFGSKIIDIDFEHSTPETMNLSGQLLFGRASYDSGPDAGFCYRAAQREGRQA